MSVQIWEARRRLARRRGGFEQGEFSELRDWLRENLYTLGPQADTEGDPRAHRSAVLSTPSRICVTCATSTFPPEPAARPAVPQPEPATIRPDSYAATTACIVVQHHGRRRQVVPRPHDRPGRRGHPAADAQRDRPVAGAVRVHADLPDRHRGAVADGLARRAVHDRTTSAPNRLQSLGTDIPTLVALLVCLIPTTIGALLAAIGIAGMDRALRANIIAKSGKAVEVAGDIDTLLLDKTGTITIGNRRATQFVPLGDARRRRGGPAGRAWPRWPTRRPRARASSTCTAQQSAGDGRRPRRRRARGSSSSPPRRA